MRYLLRLRFRQTCHTSANNTLRSQIDLVFEKLLKFTILLVFSKVFRSPDPEGKILAIDIVSKNRLNSFKKS